MHQVRIAPGPDAAAAIGRDVVGAPTGLNCACEFLSVVQRKKEVSRRMALATVAHRFGEVCAAIPLGAALDVGRITLVGIEQYRPDTHETALVEWKRKGIIPRRGVD